MAPAQTVTLCYLEGCEGRMNRHWLRKHGSWTAKPYPLRPQVISWLGTWWERDPLKRRRPHWGWGIDVQEGYAPKEEVGCHWGYTRSSQTPIHLHRHLHRPWYLETPLHVLPGARGWRGVTQHAESSVCNLNRSNVTVHHRADRASPNVTLFWVPQARQSPRPGLSRHPLPPRLESRRVGDNEQRVDLGIDEEPTVPGIGWHWGPKRQKGTSIKMPESTGPNNDTRHSDTHHVHTEWINLANQEHPSIF